jgi:glyoxylate utilization-related uncharacterized protein
MNRTLDLRKVFGMIVTYDDAQELVSPTGPFDVITELQPGGKSAIHIHPSQDEIYEVKQGEMEVFIAGKWSLLRAGEKVTIPKGTVHGFRNAGTQSAIAFNRHDPGLRFGEMLVTIQQYINDNKIKSTSGFRNLAHMSSITVQYSDVMVPVKPPSGLVRFMAKAGKLFGYK